jgi:hypothetical protein
VTEYLGVAAHPYIARTEIILEGAINALSGAAPAILKVRGARFYSIFWVWSSSGGIVKVVRAWRRVDQEGKTT